jgi:hypothetical protein
MIPTNKEIRSKLTQDQIQYVLLNNKTYFKTADDFITLHRRFAPESFISKISLWVDMLVSPLITLFQIIFYKKMPDMFTVLTIYKTASIWLDWFRWKEMQQTIREWIKIVRTIGGPFISCNDAEYHMFVYADGMQRIHDSLLGSRVSKERAKRLK